MKSNASPQDHGRNEEIINILKRLRSLRAEYPVELFTARRAEFFDQIEQYRWAQSTQEILAEEQEIVKLFKSLKSAEADYPPNLMIARRAVFRRQLALANSGSVLEALRNSIRSLFSYKMKSLSIPAINLMRTSLVVIVLMLAAFAGSLLRAPVRSFQATPSSGGISQPGGGWVATSTSEVARVVCEPGYVPPLCLAKATVESDDLTFQGNGSARPAVAKDALPDRGRIHKAAYVNDGLYGERTSWISNSAYSWIKIDLGKAATINTIAFGKDRLGNFVGGDPGQFVIAVALSDNVYADGNNSNDYVEYTEIYDSERAGFNGVVSGPETILAHFGPVTARFIKITFANPRTAVDEVDALMIQPSGVANHPTRKPRDDSPGTLPTSIPPRTPVISAPTRTALPASTNTPVPADTATSIPTDTSVPTEPPKPIPTDTPVPPDTPVPAPTDPPIPDSTDTSVPVSINVVQPTDTSEPPNHVEPVDTPAETSIPVQP